MKTALKHAHQKQKNYNNVFNKTKYLIKTTINNKYNNYNNT